MEGLISVVASLVMLMVLAIPIAFAYKHREKIKRWVHDVDYGSEWYRKPVVSAERDIIKARWRLEDAEARLKFEQDKEEKRKDL